MDTLLLDEQEKGNCKIKLSILHNIYIYYYLLNLLSKLNFFFMP